MTQLNVVDAPRGERGGYKVDVNRGERVGRVSSELFSRPADERYLSLSELQGAVRGRTERSKTRTAETAAIRVKANRNDAERLTLLLPGEEVPLAPTHWSFGQLTTMVGAPSTYLRQLPASLAASNLQYGLSSQRAELIKTLEVEDGRVELRAVTGPDYGRITAGLWDYGPRVEGPAEIRAGNIGSAQDRLSRKSTFHQKQASLLPVPVNEAW